MATDAARRVPPIAEELLSRIQREIRERKDAARAAYEESRRLEAALAALESDGGTPEPREPVRRSRRAGPVSRRPRGENRQRILEAVADRPGASAGQIAEVTGIKRPTVASTLAKLVAYGELERLSLPSGGVGFKTADRPRGAAEAAGDESPDGAATSAPADEVKDDVTPNVADASDGEASEPSGDDAPAEVDRDEPEARRRR